jgi:hypothetical protein
VPDNGKTNFAEVVAGPEKQPAVVVGAHVTSRR